MNRMFKFPIVFLLLLVLVTVMPVGFSEISSVSVTPNESSVIQGQNAIFSVTVTNESMSTALGTTFSIEENSVAAQFSPSELNLRKNQSGTVTLTISTESLETGSYPLTIKASVPVQKKQVASEASSNQIILEIKAPIEDTTAPVSNLEITSGNPGNDGWYTSDIGIKLTATDSDGSGVKEINYSLNDGPVVNVTGVSADITINTDGPNGLIYWAVDNAGNVEASKSVDFIIDKKVPVVQGSGIKTDGSSYSNGTTTDQEITVSLEASDENLASFMVDGAEWFETGTIAKRTVEVTEEGTTIISYVAKDLAGNTSSGVFTVVIDKTIQQPTSIHYVALGDSIATGSTSRGTTTSYVYGFYNHLKMKDPTATMKNLSYDGDKSSDLLRRLGEEAYSAEVKKASVITLTIGGNNIMDAARASSFSSIDKVMAEAGTTAFEAEYDLIIQAIRVHNPRADIVAVTLYNPYNSVKITGYTNDPLLRVEAEKYISRINAKITGISNDSRYRVVDVHNYFKLNYADKGRMGRVTYFYPFYWFSFTRDPHPNQTGQNVITNLHNAAYPLY